MKVLVIDEHEQSGSRASQILQRAGHAPFYCKGGGAALTLLKMQKFDAVLLDENMHNMDTLFLSSQIHETNPAAKIVLLVGHDSEGLHQRFAPAGIAAYVEKAMLERRLSVVLGGFTKH